MVIRNHCRGPERLWVIAAPCGGLFFSDLCPSLLNTDSQVFEKLVGMNTALAKIFQETRHSDERNLESGSSASSAPSSPALISRYLSDFEELKSLGHGGFGSVKLCKNKLDGREYAVKKIYLMDKTLKDRILREVAALSRLHHRHVVRYYQAWFETEVGGSRTDGSSAGSYNSIGSDNMLESTCLYIQMEYCSGTGSDSSTLRGVIDSSSSSSSNFQENVWHYFRQIVEGLVHIHGQGIIHCDLTPMNIFFDAQNDIKIGDFGNAKLKLEQVDHDPLSHSDHKGTYYYTAPEIEKMGQKFDEKVDIYSLGIIFFELWHTSFTTLMERNQVLDDLKKKNALPSAWESKFPVQTSLLRRLISPNPSDRPSAIELLEEKELQGENELLDDILRRIQTSEGKVVYHKVVNAIFMTHQQNIGSVELARDTSSFLQCTEHTELRDYVVEVAKEVFKQHGAKRMEITPMHVLDDSQQFHRDGVKLLSCKGDMLELCHELRLPFVSWVIKNQTSSFKRYEISWVYKKGQSSPNRYLQGDFDIIGGESVLTEAEVIKATIDIIARFFPMDSCDVRLNHGDLLEAMWTWIGNEADLRHHVSKHLSLPPQERNLTQLLHGFNLSDAVSTRLKRVQTIYCGIADKTLPILRGAPLPDLRALDELKSLYNYLRVWRIENVLIDTLMPPKEGYHRKIFFQIYFNSGSSFERLALGGRYDHLLHQMRDNDSKSNPPSAVGTSLELESIIQHFPISSVETKPSTHEAGNNVLICCSKGGSGSIEERMKLADELWQANIKAQFVPISEPSLEEQLEYAKVHDIKCLVFITDTGL